MEQSSKNGRRPLAYSSVSCWPILDRSVKCCHHTSRTSSCKKVFLWSKRTNVAAKVCTCRDCWRWTILWSLHSCGIHWCSSYSHLGCKCCDKLIYFLQKPFTFGVSAWKNRRCALPGRSPVAEEWVPLLRCPCWCHWGVTSSFLLATGVMLWWRHNENLGRMQTQ